MDTLVDAVRRGGVLVVDLSGVETMTRSGVRGLVVAAKLSEQACGKMRICGADPSVRALLNSLGFAHLLKVDGTVGEAIAALGGKLSKQAA